MVPSADWLLKHPRIDFTAALIGALLAFRVLEEANHLALVGVVAGVSGTLLGLTGVVMGLYSPRTNDALDQFKDLHLVTINKNWRHVLTGFAVACMLGLVSSALPVGWPARIFLGYGLAITVFSALRLSWFLGTYFTLSSSGVKAASKSDLDW